MSKKYFLLGILIIVFSVSVAGAVFAQGDPFGLEATAGAAGLKKNGDLPVLIGNVIGTALSMIGVIFFALMIYGGFIWMQARGNQEHTKKGLDTIIAAIIGILIVLGAYAITNFVFKSVGVGGGGGGGGAGGQQQQTCTPACGEGKSCVKGKCVEAEKQGLCFDPDDPTPENCEVSTATECAGSGWDFDETKSACAELGILDIEDGTAGEGETCYAGSDCVDGLVCNNNICGVSSDLCKDKSEGAPCADGKTCQSGVCKSVGLLGCCGVEGGDCFDDKINSGCDIWRENTKCSEVKACPQYCQGIKGPTDKECNTCGSDEKTKGFSCAPGIDHCVGAALENYCNANGPKVPCCVLK